MQTKPELLYAIGLPPEKAIEYFKSKDYTFSWDWHDTWQEAHAKAFTVAKAMRMDVLQDVRDMVQKALDEGITLQQFKKELTPKLQAKGWWGRKVIGDETGAQAVQLGSPRRLRTIYQTNLQVAYSVGRYKELMANVDDRPYWQWDAVMDRRTRPAHAAMNGKVFHYTDLPVPNLPCDWGCRCHWRGLSGKDLKDRKITVESAKANRTTEERLISKRSGQKAEVTVYTDPVTGTKVATGVGWNYNPAKAAWQPDLDRYDKRIAKKYIEGAVTGPDFTRFFAGKIGDNFPVAVLDEKLMQSIGSRSQTVYLSDETLAKNKDNHPEINLPDYQQLPDIISGAQLIVQDRDNTFVFFKVGDTIYYGAVKTTRSGETNFLTSLRIARPSDVAAIRKKGKVLRDEL